ncbi:MAG: hypothetical protein NT105_22195 [Verrucomicrobia bacterium]|nr:hypothetical protein [Verrucomicrobiota bacterium]
MSQAFHRQFRAVLTALAFTTFLVLLGGNVWSQNAPSTDPGLIRREWRLVGVYLGETWRKRDNLGANGFIEITGANTKSGTAKIEVRGTRGILFRQRFSWIFLQDMSVVHADQRCGVQFRLEGERATTNGNMAEFRFSEGAEPGLWKLYFPEILKGPWMVSRGNYSDKGNRVAFGPEPYATIPSSQAEFWIPGENADSASVSRFADI